MVNKVLYILIFIFAASFLEAQKATVINITKADFKNTNVLRDLIKDIPKDCIVKSYKLSVVIKGVEKTLDVTGDVISNVIKPEGEFYYKSFFIEKITSTCSGKHKQSYKVVIE